MSAINFGQSVSLKEFALGIGTVGKDVTVIGQGEPGIGKFIKRIRIGYRYCR